MKSKKIIVALDNKDLSKTIKLVNILMYPINFQIIIWKKLLKLKISLLQN